MDNSQRTKKTFSVETRETTNYELETQKILLMKEEPFVVDGITLLDGWFNPSTPYRYSPLLSQVFEYLSYRKDLKVAKNSTPAFPLSIVESLEGKVGVSGGQGGVKDALKRERVFQETLAQKYGLSSYYGTMQVDDTMDPEKDLLGVTVGPDSISVRNKEGIEEPLTGYQILSSEFQSVPLNPILHKKLFAGTLRWYQKSEGFDAKSRLVMNLLANGEELQVAIYNADKKILQQVKDLFVILEGRARNSKNFVVFMGVDSTEPLEDPELRSVLLQAHRLQLQISRLLRSRTHEAASELRCPKRGGGLHRLESGDRLERPRQLRKTGAGIAGGAGGAAGLDGGGEGQGAGLDRGGGGRGRREGQLRVYRHPGVQGESLQGV